jgi:hypothetical protein
MRFPCQSSNHLAKRLLDANFSVMQMAAIVELPPSDMEYLIVSKPVPESSSLLPREIQQNSSYRVSLI